MKKERKPPQETKNDSKCCEGEADGFEGVVIENRRCCKTYESKHLDSTVKSTADTRARQRVCPSVFWVTVYSLHRIGDNAACHDSNRHPERYHLNRGEIDPKSIFNDAVGEGIQ